MPLNRPTLQELVQRIATDIESRLPGADARLRRSNLAVMARIEAGVAHGLYGFIAYLARQIIIDTADSDWLERWAAIWNMIRHAAVAATGDVNFTGTNGVHIPSGTVLQRSDGQQFITQEEVIISGGVATAAVVGSTPGLDSATAASSQLLLTTPIAGINSVAIVASGGLTGSSDDESDDDLRARLLFRIRRPPQGGSTSDYENWSFEVPGVTRVWVMPLYLGLGTVAIFFVRDNDVSIIPDSGEIATLQAHIDEVRPVTADVSVFAPTPVTRNFTIQLTPNTSAVQAAVRAELEDVFRREAEPGGTIRISHLREAVSIAAGEVDNIMTVPSADLVDDPGDMSVMGTITWV